MSTEGATIRLATPTDVDDVDGLMALESRYYVDNLDPSRRAEGFISVLHSRDWFEDTIADGGLHVAIIDDAVAGFIGMTAPPRQAPGLPAVVSAMVSLAATVEFNGALIAEQRYAIRGPVCIAEHARGQGIYSAFNAVTAKAYQDRFDLACCSCPPKTPARCTPRPRSWGPPRWRISRPMATTTTSWRFPSARSERTPKEIR